MKDNDIFIGVYKKYINLIQNCSVFQRCDAKGLCMAVNPKMGRVGRFERSLRVTGSVWVLSLVGWFGLSCGLGSGCYLVC